LVGKWQILTYIVQYLVLNVATLESSWCDSFSSIPLKRC
jgi:hypothetical protein